MADYSQTPDILNGKGTVVDFKDYETLGSLRRAIADLLCVQLSSLVAELNHYFDLKKCGINFHGDEERRLVIGVRVGASMPLRFLWHQHGQSVGKHGRIDLDGGDVYIMSEKAVGRDTFREKRILTLRHAAGRDGTGYAGVKYGPQPPVVTLQSDPFASEAAVVPLTTEQRARIETNKRKAQETLAAVRVDPAACVVQERVGTASAYYPRFLNETANDDFLRECAELPYTIYQYGHQHGVSPVHRAPKVEYYIPNEAGERPLYRWGQTEEFWQAGHPMPTKLRAIAEYIYKKTGEKVNHAIVIAYFDGTNQFAPPHKDKAAGVRVNAGVPTDMSRDGSFFVLSLGYPRVFTLQKNWAKPPAPADIVWEKALESGSMLRVSAADNRAYCHAVHPQPGAGVRYSIIFRTIATHVPVDALAAAVANGEAHRFPRPKRSLSGPIDQFVAKKARVEAPPTEEGKVVSTEEEAAKLNPSDVLAEVNVIKSESGGATMEAVFHCSQDQSTALRDVGFAWCKEDGVLLRCHPSSGATVADLVTIDALRASYMDGECVLRARAYLHSFAFGGVDQICKNDDFSFRKGDGWVKRMSGEEYEALQVFAGMDSEEAAERQRMKAAAMAAEEKLAAAMERAAEAKAIDWQDRVRKDPMYDKRYYEYGKLLLHMSETDSVVYGSDGAPNWPDPPVPGEMGIVSRATQHLVPPYPSRGPSTSMYVSAQ